MNNNDSSQAYVGFDRVNHSNLTFKTIKNHHARYTFMLSPCFFLDPAVPPTFFILESPLVNMTKMLIIWMIFGSRLLSLFSVSAFYSFLKYLRYTTDRQANKFEELQLRFRF